MRLWTKLILVTMCVLAAAPAARVQAATPPAFAVGFIGDTGYSQGDESNLLRVRASANASGLAFVVHDGDTQKGTTPCSQRRLWAVKRVFDGFSTLVYTPGDNEWQDCPNGRPDGWLVRIRRTYFSTGNSLGRHPTDQWRQSTAVPENARWERGGVVFATLDVPGPDGGGPVGADLAWIDATFDRAAATRAPAVVIVMQDDPTDGSSANLIALLKHRAAAFRRPVLLVHGDTHVHKLDHPWRDAPNITRLETFPGFTPTWVKATVNPASPSVFSFATIAA
jgi:hypothetical protein